MKKYYFLMVLFLCVVTTSTMIYGSDLYSTANSTKIVEGDAAVEDSSQSGSTVKAEKSTTDTSDNKESDDKSSTSDNENSSSGTSLTGKGYVGVYTYLNLRQAPWGTVIARLYNNEEVTITGSEGDWYAVTTSKGSGYAHSNYIFSSKDQKYSGSSPSSSDYTSSTGNVVLNVSGDSLQGKIISAAQQLVDKYSTKLSFPYHPSTTGKSGLGSLGCAQVATTALVAAGALDGTQSYGGLAYASLSCWETVGLLEKKGWTKVQVPPFQAGDVILWNTTGKAASHIGIAMESGNSVKAMSNSSTYKIPRTHSATYSPISFVMRKS